MEWEINEGRFETGARKVRGTHMQDKENNGEKGGDKEGHLDLGTSVRGMIGTVGRRREHPELIELLHC